MSRVQEKIRLLRKKQGKSLAFVAGKLGISTSGYSLKELGSRPITINELEKIAEVLEVEPKTFLE